MHTVTDNYGNPRRYVARFVVWSQAFQHSRGYESWRDVVDYCQALPQRSHCRVAALRVLDGPGTSRAVGTAALPIT